MFRSNTIRLITCLVSLYLATANGFIVTQDNPALPKAYADGPDCHIVRVQPNNDVKLVKCPEGTVFDKASLTCAFITKSRKSVDKEFIQDTQTTGCQDKYGFPVLGVTPDFKDCRYFYLCGPGTSARVPCETGLLFNKNYSTCDWPRNAYCCEFPGHDTSKIVAHESEYSS